MQKTKQLNYKGLSVPAKLIFILIFILTVSSCEKDEKASAPLTGTAPDFSITSLDGSKVMLSDYSNKVVVLFFFGNTCPSCKAAAPSVESMLNKPYANRTDYKILGLDQWNGNEASVQAFKTETGVSFTLLLNASGVAADYKSTYDRLVVIDKNMDIVFSGNQGAAADITAVKEKLDMLFAGM